MNENPRTREAEGIGGGTAFGSNSDGESMRAQDKAREISDKTREAAGEYGHRAEEQIDRGMDQAAAGMEQAAEKLRSRTAEGEGMPAQAGMKVAEGMETAAGYLRDHDTQDMLGDLEQYVKHHPTTALAGAVVTGFLIGRILR